jgi:hypothetical protein
MSGRPYPEGVRQYRKLMQLKAESDVTLASSQKQLEQIRRDLQRELERNNSYQKDIEKLMVDMDVASPGNVGYAERLQCFIAEILKQERAETQAAMRAPVAKDEPHISDMH